VSQGRGDIGRAGDGYGSRSARNVCSRSQLVQTNISLCFPKLRSAASISLSCSSPPHMQRDEGGGSTRGRMGFPSELGRTLELLTARKVHRFPRVTGLRAISGYSRSKSCRQNGNRSCRSETGPRQLRGSAGAGLKFNRDFFASIRKCWSNSGLLLHRRRDIAVRRQTDLVAFHVGHETAVDVVVVAFVLGRQLRIRALGSKSTK
jgi:hypothetical protein